MRAGLQTRMMSAAADLRANADAVKARLGEKWRVSLCRPSMQRNFGAAPGPEDRRVLVKTRTYRGRSRPRLGLPKNRVARRTLSWSSRPQLCARLQPRSRSEATRSAIAGAACDGAPPVRVGGGTPPEALTRNGSHFGSHLVPVIAARPRCAEVQRVPTVHAAYSRMPQRAVALDALVCTSAAYSVNTAFRSPSSPASCLTIEQ
jgi:hypothetical protein